MNDHSGTALMLLDRSPVSALGLPGLSRPLTLYIAPDEQSDP